MGRRTEPIIRILLLFVTALCAVPSLLGQASTLPIRPPSTSACRATVGDPQGSIGRGRIDRILNPGGKGLTLRSIGRVSSAIRGRTTRRTSPQCAASPTHLYVNRTAILMLADNNHARHLWRAAHKQPRPRVTNDTLLLGSAENSNVYRRSYASVAACVYCQPMFTARVTNALAVPELHVVADQMQTD